MPGVALQLRKAYIQAGKNSNGYISHSLAMARPGQWNPDSFKTTMARHIPQLLSDRRDLFRWEEGISGYDSYVKVFCYVDPDAPQQAVARFSIFIGEPTELELATYPVKLNRYQVDLSEERFERNERRITALLMGTHSRLGAGSPLHSLPSNVLDDVVSPATQRGLLRNTQAMRDAVRKAPCRVVYKVKLNLAAFGDAEWAAFSHVLKFQRTWDSGAMHEEEERALRGFFE